MKLLKGLLSFFLLLTIVSCATTDKETYISVDEESVNEESTMGKNMVDYEVEEIVYFVTKEQAFYGDGQIDTITNYKYDEDYNLLNKVQTNEQGEVLEAFYNTYENGRITRRDNLGFGNVLNNYLMYNYDMDNIGSETLYDTENKVQTTNEYEYKNNDLAVWRTLGPSGGALAITEYEYNKDHNATKVMMKDALGAIDGKIEKSYKKDLLVEEKIFDSKNKLEKSTQYIYEDDKLVEKVFFDQKGKKKRSETYEYEAGVPVPFRINLLYNSGSLEAYTTYEYASKVVTSTISVEE